MMAHCCFPKEHEKKVYFIKVAQDYGTPQLPNVDDFHYMMILQRQSYFCLTSAFFTSVRCCLSPDVQRLCTLAQVIKTNRPRSSYLIYMEWSMSAHCN